MKFEDFEKKNNRKRPKVPSATNRFPMELSKRKTRGVYKIPLYI